MPFLLNTINIWTFQEWNEHKENPHSLYIESTRESLKNITINIIKLINTVVFVIVEI